MGARGPAGTPPTLKLLTGRHDGVDSGGRPIPKVPPFERGGLEMPEWIADDPTAAAEWERVVPALDRLQVAKPEDSALLAAYCQALSRYVRANKEWRDDGQPTTCLTVNGGRQVDPGFRAVESASKELRNAAREFGLTPSAENRIARDPSKGDDGDGNPFAATG